MKSIILFVVVNLALGFCFPKDGDAVSERSANKTKSADKFENPYQVGLLINKGFFTQDNWCSGVLIHRKIGLVAAHCLEEGESAKIYMKSKSGFEEAYSITKYNWVIHENYNKKTFNNNIAMFWLPKLIDIGPNADIIPIGNAQLGDVAKIVSWTSLPPIVFTAPNKFFIGNAAIISNDKCNSFFKVTSNQICVMETPFKWSTCNGDSSGPLIFNNHLVGIGSYSRGDCKRQLPDAFTKVCAYIDWINKTGALSINQC